MASSKMIKIHRYSLDEFFFMKGDIQLPSKVKEAMQMQVEMCQNNQCGSIYLIGLVIFPYLHTILFSRLKRSAKSVLQFWNLKVNMYRKR